MTDDDITQVIEGIEEFIIEGRETLRPAWQPYIDKLRALRVSHVQTERTGGAEMMHEFGDLSPMIVAEVSKNWCNGAPVNGDPRPLATLFEHVIAVNRQRGYRLHSFQIHQVMTAPDVLTETIIAVFES